MAGGAGGAGWSGLSFLWPMLHPAVFLARSTRGGVNGAIKNTRKQKQFYKCSILPPHKTQGVMVAVAAFMKHSDSREGVGSAFKQHKGP